MPHQLFYRGAMLLMVILSLKRLFFINTSSSSNYQAGLKLLGFMFAGILLKNYSNIKSVDWNK